MMCVATEPKSPIQLSAKNKKTECLHLNNNKNENVKEIKT
jgi:hypothetical protein